MRKRKSKKVDRVYDDFYTTEGWELKEMASTVSEYGYDESNEEWFNPEACDFKRLKKSFGFGYIT